MTRALLDVDAAAHDGRFVTLDRSPSRAVVHGATENHLTVL